MTGAIVGALALAGCMSLEERLASNDAHSTASSARLGAYMRLSGQGQLLQVAMTSQDNKIKPKSSTAEFRITEAKFMYAFP